MKKIVLWLLIVSLVIAMGSVFSLTGCKTTTTETTAAATTAAETTKEKDVDKTLTFGFANYTLTNPYCATMADGASARAKELGIKINIVDNKQDSANQVASIENFITLGVDGILILPVDSSAIEATVQDARDAGIHVIANSVPVKNADIFVSADNYEMGYNIGKACAEWLNKNNGGKGKVAYINMPSLPTLIDRERGFTEAIAELCPGAQIVMMVPGGTPEEALKSAETIIQAHPDISAIAGYNDLAALGACNAAEAANIDPAKIFVGGVDATPEAIAKIKEGGPFKATVDNIPYENGVLLIDLMVRLIDGEKIDYTYVLPTKIVDSSNINEY